MMQDTANPQLQIINRRLPLVTGGLVLFSILLLLALVRLQQLSPTVRQELELRSQNNTRSIKRLPAVRGVIYDRDGIPLAFNVLQYEIGVSPNLITEPERIAQQLGVILNIDEFEVYNRITQAVPWVQIARPVSAELGQQIADLDEISIVINPLSSRAYPQGQLAGPIVGFTIESNDNNTIGALGVEASYNNELAGRPTDQTISTIPLDAPIDFDNQDQRGRDVVLTIDRDIQYWMEYELARGVEQYQAEGGVIIVMDPRNGEILAMAQSPTFDPNSFAQVEDNNILRNMAVSDVQEPGSVMKILTVASALDAGAITEDWTYNDTGSLEIGGVEHVNWDLRAYGVVDTSGLLVNSLNIGAVTVALELESEPFYRYFRRFGLGQLTNIDLPGEEVGIMRVPGDEGWNEADFASNSYGQAISVTPIQMVTAFSAIANDGLMYQPHVMRQIINGDEIRNAQPVPTRVVSSQTANIVTNMMVRVINEGSTLAQVTGYSIAGKTGTAQIATPLGYEAGVEGATIATFIGFFPADDPQVVVYVRLDRPFASRWGSQTAAPLFSDIAQRLVLLLAVPDDNVRLALQSQGGVVNEQ
jgi:cell division protein FtsI/penicillin-binding protein 2